MHRDDQVSDIKALADKVLSRTPDDDVKALASCVSMLCQILMVNTTETLPSALECEAQHDQDKAMDRVMSAAEVQARDV